MAIVCNIGIPSNIVYRHCRSPIIIPKGMDTTILDACPHFGLRGVGVGEASQIAKDACANYLILPPSVKWDEASYYVEDTYGVAYMLNDPNELGNVLDEYFISAIILPPTDGRNELLRKIYNRGKMCYKEIWLWDVRGNIKDELLLVSRYSFVSLALTPIMAKLAYSGMVLTPEGLRTSPDLEWSNDLTLPTGYDIINTYNKYCVSSWAEGEQVSTIDDFMKGVLSEA